MATINSIYEPLREHLGCDTELQQVDVGDDSIILFDHTCGIILADILDGIRFGPRRRPGESDCEGCGRPMIEYCPECEGEIRQPEIMTLVQ